MTAFSSTSGSSDGFPEPSDGELLREFSMGKGQDAFTELVRRHSGLVFSTALRRSDSPELAQEAAQNVFTALARKAPRLGASGNLSPWLHRAAVLESAALIRREIRYRQAMKRRQEDPTAVPDPHLNAAGELWDSLRPRVDEALNALSTADREVLLLHHGEGRTFREIATRLGLSAEAAQRRGHRALEKLAHRLRGRGVTLPALALGGTLTSGLMSDSSAAAPALSPLLAAGKAGTLQAQAGATPAFPAWMVSPAMLVALGLSAAGLPIWWRVHEQFTRPPAEAESGNLAIATNKRPQSILPSGKPSPSPRNFLAEALSALKQSPADAGPTRLGLQLRKVMLALTREELRATGRLLKGYPANHREMISVVEAFSARLAELDPGKALDCVQHGNGKDADPDFSQSIDKAALLDVLTRNSLPLLLEAGRSNPVLMLSTLESLATHDGPSAMKNTATLLPSEFQSEGYRKCFCSWAACQPHEALQWLDGNFVEDPDRPAPLREELRVLGALASIVRRLSPQQTVSLIPLLKDDALSNEVLESFFYSYGDEHPEGMVPLVPWLRLEDEAQPVSVASLVFSWRRKDPAGAAAWAASLPAGELKAAAERCLAKPNPYEK